MALSLCFWHIELKWNARSSVRLKMNTTQHTSSPKSRNCRLIQPKTDGQIIEKNTILGSRDPAVWTSAGASSSAAFTWILIEKFSGCFGRLSIHPQKLVHWWTETAKVSMGSRYIASNWEKCLEATSAEHILPCQAIYCLSKTTLGRFSFEESLVGGFKRWNILKIEDHHQNFETNHGGIHMFGLSCTSPILSATKHCLATLQVPDDLFFWVNSRVFAGFFWGHRNVPRTLKGFSGWYNVTISLASISSSVISHFQAPAEETSVVVLLPVHCTWPGVASRSTCQCGKIYRKTMVFGMERVRRREGNVDYFDHLWSVVWKGKLKVHSSLGLPLLCCPFVQARCRVERFASWSGESMEYFGQDPTHHPMLGQSYITIFSCNCAHTWALNRWTDPSIVQYTRCWKVHHSTRVKYPTLFWESGSMIQILAPEAFALAIRSLLQRSAMEKKRPDLGLCQFLFNSRNSGHPRMYHL